MSSDDNDNGDNTNPSGVPRRRRIVRAVRPPSRRAPPPPQAAAAAQPLGVQQLEVGSSDDSGSSSDDDDMPPLLEEWGTAPAAAANRSRNNTNDNTTIDAEEADDEPVVSHSRGNPFAVLQQDSDDDDDDDEYADMPPLLDPDDDSDDDMPPLLDPNDDDSVQADDDDDDEYDDEDDSDYDEDEDEDFADEASLEDFMRYMMATGQVYGDDEDDDDSDDDDEDGEYCDCPRCSMRRFMRHMAQAGATRPRDPSAGITRFNGPSAPPPVMDESLDGTEGGSTVDNPDAPTCAVCLEHESSRRPLVTLPCCGTTDVEEASSTRFCQKCLHKCLRTKAVHGRNGCVIGECPRCKRLLSATQDRAVAKATPSQIFKYIIVQPQRYHVHLVVVAWAYHNLIPVELLDLKQNDTMSQECVSRLVQWGLLQKKEKSSSSSSSKSSSSGGNGDNKGEVYCIDANLQTDLREFCATQLLAEWGDEHLEYSHTPNRGRNVRPQCLMAAIQILSGAWETLKQYRLGRALRLANRAVTLGLISSSVLPNFTEWRDEKFAYAATALNVSFVYLVGKILVQAVWIVVYVGTGFGVAVLTGWWMKAPPPRTWKRVLRNAGTGAAALGAALYFGRGSLRGAWGLARAVAVDLAVGWGWATRQRGSSEAGPAAEL